MGAPSRLWVTQTAADGRCAEQRKDHALIPKIPDHSSSHFPIMFCTAPLSISGAKDPQSKPTNEPEQFQNSLLIQDISSVPCWAWWGVQQGLCGKIHSMNSSVLMIERSQMPLWGVSHTLPEDLKFWDDGDEHNGWIFSSPEGEVRRHILMCFCRWH